MSSYTVTSPAGEPSTSSVSPVAHGLLFVLSGPSGVGKDRAIDLLKKRPSFDMHHAITMTTRAMRAQEVDGRDYFFSNHETFIRMQSSGDLLEWALVHENYYGTPLDQVRPFLSRGIDVLLKIDVQGAAKVKQRAPDAVFIFLAPPSLSILEERLRQRHTESQAELAVRLDDARREMDALITYDYCVVNHQDLLHDAVDKIGSIVQAERCRVKRRVVLL